MDRYKITFGPASRRISATWVLTAVLIAVQTWNFIISREQSSLAREAGTFTCIMISRSVSGAGRTSVMSCAAAEVINDPADRTAECMRGASDSRLNGKSGEGKLKEFAATAASICSTDDCMMFARVFNSAKASCETLPWRALSDTLNITNTCGHTSQQMAGWRMSLTVKTRE